MWCIKIQRNIVIVLDDKMSDTISVVPWLYFYNSCNRPFFVSSPIETWQFGKRKRQDAINIHFKLERWWFSHQRQALTSRVLLEHIQPDWTWHLHITGYWEFRAHWGGECAEGWLTKFMDGNGTRWISNLFIKFEVPDVRFSTWFYTDHNAVLLFMTCSVSLQLWYLIQCHPDYSRSFS